MQWTQIGDEPESFSHSSPARRLRAVTTRPTPASRAREEGAARRGSQARPTGPRRSAWGGSGRETVPGGAPGKGGELGPANPRLSLASPPTQPPSPQRL